MLKLSTIPYTPIKGKIERKNPENYRLLQNIFTNLPILDINIMQATGKLCPNDRQYGFVFLSLLFLLLSPEITMVGAQSGSDSGNNNQYGYPRFSPSIAIIIVVLVAFLFFVGFFSIYIRHCSTESGSVRQAFSMRRRASVAPGLDHSVIETFPTFTYSEVKDHKIGKGTLECAVCLNEFEDDETLRLIPKCDHVFHPECIDAWLESHVTCPVCRANLVPQTGDEPVVAPESGNTTCVTNQNVERINSVRNEEFVVQIASNGENQSQPENVTVGPVTENRNSSLEYPNRPPRSWSLRGSRMFGFGKFRSHSTGHSMSSLVQPDQNLDRFTLRLPEEVRREVLNRAMFNRTRSCATTLPRQGSSRRAGGAEGSRRTTRRIERSDREANSNRWSFNFTLPTLTRGLSIRSPKPKVTAENGEGSTSKKGKMPVKMPSFKCLEPKSGDENRDDSTRPPV